MQHRFSKGNQASKGVKKPRAGRPKGFKRQVDEAMSIIDQELPNIITLLVQKAKEGDRDALIYLIDRRMGKPKQQTEIKGAEELGAGMLAMIYRAVAEARRRQIEAPHDDSQASVTLL